MLRSIHRLVGAVVLAVALGACSEASRSEEPGPELASRAFESRAPQYRTSAALATGSRHACTVLADGTVRCWGDNTDGQLGDGSTDDGLTPVTPSGLSSVVSVAAGGDHTCALRSDGTVLCWGDKSSGQLGSGVWTTTDVLQSVDDVTNAVAIALGSLHSCALIADGTVRCWGSNTYGQLGDTTLTTRYTAVQVSTISNAIAIAANGNHTCALISGGTVRCWGQNNYGQVGDGTTTTPRATPVSVGGLGYVTAISVGYEHTCALIEDGTVRCWGDNMDGQLGNGASDTYSVTPVTVSGLSNVVNLSAGDDRTCAVLGDGTARCWGWGANGEVGNGAYYNVNSTPMTVSGLGNVVAISTGGFHSCALLASGSLRCWGWGGDGELGNGGTARSTTPVAVSGISNGLGGARLATGSYHTCAARPDGTAACWGSNGDGRLGDGTELPRASPVTVTGLSNVVSLTAGYGHTCALLGDGTAKCWGSNLSGGLGCCSTVPSPTPVAVTGLTNAVAISAGRFHTCALRSDGTVMCWGSNADGQVGDGTTGGGRGVVQVTGIPDANGARAIAIAAGDDHTCAVLSDGKARCWGDNTYGQLGNGSTSPSATPVAVSVLTRAVAITAGWKHTCAVTASGTAYCWGDDSFGQVGDGAGSSGSVTRPVAVSGLSDAVTISAGWLHTCATTAAGGARCWGVNTYGHLGDTTHTTRYEPATVQGAMAGSPSFPTYFPMNSAVTIDTGQNHSCAMRSNGTIRCWGSNASGQLGDGTNTSSDLPVTVIGFP